VTVYQRGGRGNWTADFHFVDQNGKRQHGRRSMKTRHRRIAEQRASKLDQQLEKGEVTATAVPAMSINDASTAFLESKRTDGRSRKTLLKYGGELKLFAQYLTEKGVTTLKGITAHHCDTYKAHRKDHDQLEDYTLYTMMIVLKTFLRWCKGRDFLTNNPLAELRVSKPRRRKHPAATLPQVNAVLYLAVTTASTWFAVFATLAMAGLRIGELVALRREDVNLVEGLIHVRHRAGWQPKTEGSERDAPIHPRLLAILKAMSKSKGEYFFNAVASAKFPMGDNHVNPRDANEVFQKLAVLCNFAVGRKDKGLTLHALRRFFKTFCLDSGVPAAMVNYWMGHTDQDSMDFFYYDPRKSKEWMQRMPFGEPSDKEIESTKGIVGDAK
jgi:integrase